MTHISNNLSAVLRRRALRLEREGYNDGFTTSIRLAAELIGAQERYAEDHEQAYLEAVADNRRLRAALVQSHNRIATAAMPRAERAALCSAIVNTIKASPAPGDGRVIVAIQVGDDETEAVVTERTLRVIAEYFQQRQPGEPNGTTTDRHEGGGDPAEAGERAGSGAGDVDGREEAAGAGAGAEGQPSGLRGGAEQLLE